MTDRHQEIVTKLAELRRIVDEATLGPWRSEESRDTWTLHGEAREFKGKTKNGIGPSMQILKAPKRGTSYAEYWPNTADTAMIIESANRFVFWLDWAEDVARRHYPVPCGCRKIHFLCAEHRMYQWDQCPEMLGLIKAVEMLHG